MSVLVEGTTHAFGWVEAPNAPPVHCLSFGQDLEWGPYFLTESVTHAPVVAIPGFGSSMHDAKARVHRSESGSLLAGASEKEDLARKYLKKGKKEKKRGR